MDVQAEIEAEWGVWSPAEVARRAGSRGHSRTVAVKRWQAAGKIFPVPVAGSDHYPGFQFDATGRPHPELVAILRAIGARLSGWDLAAWFVTPSEQLGGRRPVDALGEAAQLASMSSIRLPNGSST